MTNTVPSGAATGKVQVTTPAGRFQTVRSFEYCSDNAEYECRGECHAHQTMKPTRLHQGDNKA